MEIKLRRLRCVWKWPQMDAPCGRETEHKVGVGLGTVIYSGGDPDNLTVEAPICPECLDRLRSVVYPPVTLGHYSIGPVSLDTHEPDPALVEAIRKKQAEIAPVTERFWPEQS